MHCAIDGRDIHLQRHTGLLAGSPVGGREGEEEEESLLALLLYHVKGAAASQDVTVAPQRVGVFVSQIVSYGSICSYTSEQR